MNPLCFHQLEDHGDVQRHHWNGGRRLSDNGFQYGNVRGTVQRSQLVTQFARGAIKVFFRFAQRAVPVDWPGQVGTDVGVGYGFHSVSQHARFAQRAHPQFPVLAAHYGNGVLHFFFGCRLNAGGDDLIFVGIDRFRSVNLTDWLQRRTDDFTGFRHFTHWGSQ